MGVQAIESGYDTTRVPTTAEGQAVREQAARRARHNLSVEAMDRHPGAREGDPEALRAARRWRDEMYALLDLAPGDTPAVEPARPAAPAADPSGEPRVVATIGRHKEDDTDWRLRGSCRDWDPELWFPVGTTGPALLQMEQAKAICRRCPVLDRCEPWAVEHQEFGVAGGMDEDERRAVRRRGGKRGAR